MIGTLTLEKQVIRRISTRQDQVKVFEFGPDPIVKELLNDLSPHTPWGERQIAAKKLGQLRSTEAIPGLLTALQNDNFWMVRCAIIQSLEQIKDPRVLPVLEEVALKDGFQVVRSYALKAIERLAANQA